MDSGFQKIDNKNDRWGVMALIVAASMAFTACGGGGGGGSGDGTASAENRDYPGSIVGERIEFTVTEAGANSVAEGLTVVYDFSSDGQVQGTNPETGQVLTPVRYEYTPEGRNASIRLYYEYDNGGAGYEDYDLVAGDSILQGTYDYEAVVTSGGCCGGGAKGNYRIIPPNNVSFYRAENAAELSEDAASILQQMTRRNDLASVSMELPRNAYVAIDSNGELVADTSLKTRNVLTPGGFSEDQTVTLPFPPSGKFQEAAIGKLLGGALSENGEYLIWSGESNLDPREDDLLPAPVHSIVDGSQGKIVIAGPDRQPKNVCVKFDTSNCFDRDNLDQFNIQDVDRAAISNRSFFYTDINNRMLRVADVNLSRFPSEEVAQIPAGLDPIAKFKVWQSRFVVAITINGDVVAWDWEGNYLDVPEAASNNVIDVSVGISPDFDTGNAKYDVAVVREDGVGVIWTYNWNDRSVSDVRTPDDARDSEGVVVTPYRGHFLFLKTSGS
ncbi:hypothetical protein [Marinobacter sp. ATCH36]|uniref:hypothetical protein n=1 Tax=Marinobacter sp. ATCH36 TaxID=2945106 RepID=UPI002020C287|nr:hypothetical protein [Marinobacter sp. ATCH36]MCL7942823.1 hypothetical protein [Marinobacter sp. ATCH36]